MKGLVVVRPGSPGPSPSCESGVGCRMQAPLQVPHVPCPSPAQGSHQTRGCSQQEAHSRGHSAAVSPPLRWTRKIQGFCSVSRAVRGRFYHAANTPLPGVISIKPTGRLSVSV